MILGLFECRAGDFVLGREPIEPSHRALPSVEGQEWYRETPDMAQQQPWSLKYCVAIRDPSRQDRAVEQPSTGKELGEISKTRAVHRINRIPMIGIAKRHSDKNQPALGHEFETMLGQLSGLQYMLEQVAAEQCIWLECTESADIGGIRQVGPHVDARLLTHIDVNYFDATSAQRAEHLNLDPRLYSLAHRGRAAAEVEHRRKSLGRERVERLAEPKGLSFERRARERSDGKRHDAPIE